MWLYWLYYSFKLFDWNRHKSSFPRREPDVRNKGVYSAHSVRPFQTPPFDFCVFFLCCEDELTIQLTCKRKRYLRDCWKTYARRQGYRDLQCASIPIVWRCFVVCGLDARYVSDGACCRVLMEVTKYCRPFGMFIYNFYTLLFDVCWKEREVGACE